MSQEKPNADSDDQEDLDGIEIEYNEKERFQGEYYPLRSTYQHVPYHPLKTPIRIAIFCHLFLITILVAILGTAAAKLSKDNLSFGYHLLDSPAKEAVKWEKVVLDHSISIDNSFKGQPRPEQDAAWNSLVLYQKLVISNDKLDATGAVQLNDGTDRVLFTLNVFHNLHCLNYIRKFIFRSGNYEDMFPELGRDGQLDHAGYCVDMIRQSIICEGDISISTYDWKIDHLLPWPNFRVAHECVNWDNIVDWARKHAAPNLRGSILMHPKYGPSYPIVQGNE
ncbi:tat pathway signal sequence [Trichoderma barbatum]